VCKYRAKNRFNKQLFKNKFVGSQNGRLQFVNANISAFSYGFFAFKKHQNSGFNKGAVFCSYFRRKIHIYFVKSHLRKIGIQQFVHFRLQRFPNIARICRKIDQNGSRFLQDIF